MSRLIVDEIHLSATVDQKLVRRRVHAVVVTLAHRSFLLRLGRAIRAAVAEYPELKPVRWRLTR